MLTNYAGHVQLKKHGGNRYGNLYHMLLYYLHMHIHGNGSLHMGDFIWGTYPRKRLRDAWDAAGLIAHHEGSMDLAEGHKATHDIS